MSCPTFSEYFCGKAQDCLLAAIGLAIKEDGTDFTSYGIFSHTEQVHAQVIAKQQTFVSGLPIIPFVMEQCLVENKEYTWKAYVQEGSNVPIHTIVAEIIGPVRQILQVERIILNFISHLSGITNLTRQYVAALEGTGVRLLDTRKTLPGLRYPDKYAVLCGGGMNHRCNLEELLLIKDNHIDAAGSITHAVTRLRKTYNPCPPIEVECRNYTEVKEAILCHVNRIMLDNMPIDILKNTLTCIPQTIEVEISGGVTLEKIHSLATSNQRKPDYISVGCITNAAPAADFSLYIIMEKNI